jgi:hypothetical protein
MVMSIPTLCPTAFPCRACGSPSAFGSRYCSPCLRAISARERDVSFSDHPRLTKPVIDASRALTLRSNVRAADLPPEAFETIEEQLDRYRAIVQIAHSWTETGLTRNPEDVAWCNPQAPFDFTNPARI